jgi:hypothetical protein
MSAVVDGEGRELFVSARVTLLRDIEMERLFAGYDTALAGAPLPRDLRVGDEGVVLGIEEAPEPGVMVEFRLDGTPFWRGALRPDEVRVV